MTTVNYNLGLDQRRYAQQTTVGNSKRRSLLPRMLPRKLAIVLAVAAGAVSFAGGFAIGATTAPTVTKPAPAVAVPYVPSPPIATTVCYGPPVNSCK